MNNSDSDKSPSMKNRNVPMSPFRVDYAGDVIDITKSSGDESLDDNDDLAMELAASTESETEVLEIDVDDHLANEKASSSSSSPPILKPTDNKANSSHSSNDRTTLTELDSLSSSVRSDDAEEVTKTEPPSAATAPPTETSTTATKEATTSTSTPRNSRVSFSQIQIREYPIIVGDNPAVLTGTPITIDWDHVDEMEFHLDEYEQGKVQQPRTMVELRMPASHRDAILKSQGFSLSERNHGKKLANLTKNRRKRTSETMKLFKAAEAVESWTRATRNATWGRRRKQQERSLLHPYRSSEGHIGSTKSLDMMSCSSIMSSNFLDNSERTI